MSWSFCPNRKKLGKNCGFAENYSKDGIIVVQSIKNKIGHTVNITISSISSLNIAGLKKYILLVLKRLIFNTYICQHLPVNNIYYISFNALKMVFWINTDRCMGVVSYSPLYRNTVVPSLVSPNTKKMFHKWNLVMHFKWFLKKVDTNIRARNGLKWKILCSNGLYFSD